MVKHTDLWRSGIIAQPVETLLRDGLDAAKPIWLPDAGPFRFHADPFGLWRDEGLHIFAEFYDYRDRHGMIDHFHYDRDLQLLGQQRVLREPWHLSYPFVFEHAGEVYMLPEAFRSGTLTLYRADPFPDHWTAVTTYPLDGPAIDATPLFWNGLWYLFYAPSATKAERLGHLNIAWAETLTGPWQLHPGNPVRIDAASARMGGRPIVTTEGRLILPVQDNRHTYGGAIRLLEVTTLSPTNFAAHDRAGLSAVPAFAPHVDGLHTLSAAGPVTLFDIKHRDASMQGLAIHAAQWLRKIVR